MDTESNNLPSILIDAKLIKEFSEFHKQKMKKTYKDYIIDGELFHEETSKNYLCDEDLLEFEIIEFLGKDDSNIMGTETKDDNEGKTNIEGDCSNKIKTADGGEDSINRYIGAQHNDYCNYEVNEKIGDKNSEPSGERHDTLNEFGADFNLNDIRSEKDVPKSYADIASKPNPYQVPLYKELEIGDKLAKVEFDTWHMVTVQKKTNSFYCMACRESCHIKFKKQHCLDVHHVENLMKCPIVEDFKEHVVRKVSDRLYHCGHCNNLQTHDDMGIHIETVHKKATTVSAHSTKRDEKTVESNIQKKANDTAIDNVSNSSNNNPANMSCTDTKSTINIGNVRSETIFNANIESANRQALNLPAANIPTEADTIIIAVFGYSFRVPLLSFHLIEKRSNCYYCVLCRIVCHNDFIIHHIFNDINHALRIRQTLFCAEYKYHLIRNTENGFHCLVCNVYVKFDPVLHFREPMHSFLVNKARIQPVWVVHPSLQEQANAQTENVNYTEEHKTNTAQSSIILNSTQSEVKEATKLTETVEQRNGNQKTVNKRNGNKETVEDQTKEENKDEIENRIENDSKNSNKLQQTQQENEDEIENANENNKKPKTEPLKSKTKAFNLDDFVYVRIRNTYAKITLAAYNSLVATGNGCRYCFVCSVEVLSGDLTDHVGNQNHLKNMESTKFLLNYEQHCLRQISSTYHCALCNITTPRQHIKVHFLWPPHSERLTQKIVKNVRRNEIKSGIEEIVCSTQQDTLKDFEEASWNVLAHFECGGPQDVVKRNKIIKVNDIVLKVSWDAYHGIGKTKGGYKCLICLTECKSYELGSHVATSNHLAVLDECFQLEYIPALIRKVNEITSHCLSCNAQVPNTSQMIKNHLDGKKHAKMYQEVVIKSFDSNANQQDVLVLTTGSSSK